MNFNNDDLLKIQDFIKVCLDKMTLPELLEKYSMDINEYDNLRKIFTKDYGIKSAFIYKSNELDNREEASLKDIKDDDFIITAISTRTNSDGQVIDQWTRRVKKNYEDISEEDLIKNIKEAIKNVSSETKIDLLTHYKNDANKNDYSVLIPIADLHLGLKVESNMTSHGFEWNADICENVFLTSMSELLQKVPTSKELIIADLGDITHHFNNENVTPKSKHKLDVSNSYENTFNKLFKMMVNVIESALQKFDKVYFYSVPGNHNLLVNSTLKVALSAYFGKEERVFIKLDKHSNIEYHSFGLNLLTFTHGDLVNKRPKSGQSLFTAVVADNKGCGLFYKNFDAYLGHIHQNKMDQDGLLSIRYVQPIIPTDVWADTMGFRSLKNPGFLQAFVYHKTQGMVNNICVNDTYEIVVNK